MLYEYEGDRKFQPDDHRLASRGLLNEIKYNPQSRKSGTIRESNQASGVGVRKAHYICFGCSKEYPQQK